MLIGSVSQLNDGEKAISYWEGFWPCPATQDFSIGNVLLDWVIQHGLVSTVELVHGQRGKLYPSMLPNPIDLKWYTYCTSPQPGRDRYCNAKHLLRVRK